MKREEVFRSDSFCLFFYTLPILSYIYYMSTAIPAILNLHICSSLGKMAQISVTSASACVSFPQAKAHVTVQAEAYVPLNNLCRTDFRT